MSYTSKQSGYTIGSDSYKSVNKIIENYGKRVFIITDDKSKGLIRDMDLDLKTNGRLIIKDKCRFQTVVKLLLDIKVQKSDMIFAFGDTKSIDTAKIAADRLDKPLFTFPTSLESSADSRSVSVVYRENNLFEKYYISKNPPIHTFINTNMIINDSYANFLDGITEILSKEYKFKKSENYINKIAHHLQDASIDILEENLLDAIKDFKDKKITKKLESIIYAILINDGFITNVISDNPNYGLSFVDAISYSLNKINFNKAYLNKAIAILSYLDYKDLEDKKRKIEDLFERLEIMDQIKNYKLSKDDIENLISEIKSIYDKEFDEKNIRKSLMHISK